MGIDFPFQYNNNNAEKKLPMQSVFKYHIALAVLDLVDQGKLSLDQKVFIKKSELLPKYLGAQFVRKILKEILKCPFLN